MTAINAFLTPARGYVMTDASMYTAQGLVIGFGQKAVAMPSLRAVLAVQGVQKTAGLLALEMSVTFETMDDLMAAGPAYFDRILPVLTDAYPDALRHTRIVVVGWSDARNGPVGCHYDTATGEWDEVDGWVMAPLTDDEQDCILSAQRCLLDVNLQLRDFDPDRHGVRIMEAQRRMKIVPIGADLDEAISIVGGHVLVSEITLAGVRQYVAHRWPDVVGENIRADEATRPNEAAQPKLSRQQRRAWEKKHGRAAA